MLSPRKLSSSQPNSGRVDVELISRYRYAAVCNHADGTGPLAAYFHGELMNLPGASASIFDRNKFLAEDRILAFGKLGRTRRRTKWLADLLRNRDEETGEMEITIRQIGESGDGRPLPSPRVHLSASKMVERVSPQLPDS